MNLHRKIVYTVFCFPLCHGLVRRSSVSCLNSGGKKAPDWVAFNSSSMIWLIATKSISELKWFPFHVLLNDLIENSPKVAFVALLAIGIQNQTLPLASVSKASSPESSETLKHL